MRAWIIGLTVFITTFFLSCKPQPVFDKDTALLDSIKIVLQVKINELQRTQENIKQASFSGYTVYASFLKSNLPDTIAKSEAVFIQQFLNSGRAIQQFNNELPGLLKESKIAVSQLQKLSGDVKENNIASNQKQNYIQAETKHANQTIETIEKNIRALNGSLFVFNANYRKTEEYIKKNNHGQLPSLVTETE